jgi:hypothetical protein
MKSEDAVSRTLVVLAYQSPVLRSFAFALPIASLMPAATCAIRGGAELHGSLAEPSLELFWLELKLAGKMFFAESQVCERIF